MNNPIKRRTCVYVVRIWAEYLNEQPPCWRGIIEGSEPGEKVPFTSLEEMRDMIVQKILSVIHNEE
jgi:hypothetical protein